MKKKLIPFIITEVIQYKVMAVNDMQAHNAGAARYTENNVAVLSRTAEAFDGKHPMWARVE